MGTAFCASVNYPTSKFFSGTLFTTSVGAEKVFINGAGDYYSDGHMRIGKMDNLLPSFMWNWQGAIDIKVQVKTNNTENGILIIDEGNTNGAISIFTASDKLNGTAMSSWYYDGYSFIENFKIKNSGYVYAREIEVKTGTFPDYVFEKDYNLMPIQELKKYIDENKHLPNMPKTEAVIEENLKT